MTTIIPNRGHDLTKREQEILRTLSNGEWHSEDTLKTHWWFLRDMALQNYVDGAFINTGSTKDDRVWRITDHGRDALMIADR